MSPSDGAPAVRNELGPLQVRQCVKQATTDVHEVVGSPHDGSNVSDRLCSGNGSDGSNIA